MVIHHLFDYWYYVMLHSKGIESGKDMLISLKYLCFNGSGKRFKFKKVQVQVNHNTFIWIAPHPLTLKRMGSENNTNGWMGGQNCHWKTHFGVSELPQNVRGGGYTHTNLKSRRTDL